MKIKTIIKMLLWAGLTALALWVAVSYLEIGFTDWYLGETESTNNFFKVIGVIR